MKRKSSARPGWTRVPRRRFEVHAVPGGLLTCLEVLEVRAPLTVPCCGEPRVVADAGYRWVQFFPEGARHALTTMWTPRFEVAQWYVDVTDGWGVDPGGVPWHDDLYLDVIATPQGCLEVIDADDLEAALQAGAVTPGQYRAAWQEARAVEAALRAGTFAPVAASRAHLEVCLG
ncbi:hypothetical protein HNR42_000680 [Deinobacterium chartae]|uniref:DUF402 domain-containing protein n=1 Tax=Deinobacterium chartae TaxID=521158 RepID=A0A841HWH1_9DEIO|nr:DUF402 domain-containing protein [Deinobacterium chartae]MBB6097266.1 hypothetical protein [Deinobacterium chartae]